MAVPMFVATLFAPRPLGVLESNGTPWNFQASSRIFLFIPLLRSGTFRSVKTGNMSLLTLRSSGEKRRHLFARLVSRSMFDPTSSHVSCCRCSVFHCFSFLVQCCLAYGHGDKTRTMQNPLVTRPRHFDDKDSWHCSVLVSCDTYTGEAYSCAC